MDTASWTDPPPTAGRGDTEEVRSPARPAPPVPGPDSGLPRVRARSTPAPAAVPSLDEAADPDTSTSDDCADETPSAGPIGLATAPAPTPAPAPTTAPGPASF